MMKAWKPQIAGVLALATALTLALPAVQAAGIPNDVPESVTAHQQLREQYAAEARLAWEATQAPPAVLLQNVPHEYQGWNNCGPTTIAMDLRFFGLNIWQKDSAPVLKPNPDDKNVSPYEMVAYAKSQGMGAMLRTAGSIEQVKRLVTHGIPVIIHIWYLPEDLGGWGHYRLLKGYDDSSQTLYFSDAFLGPDVQASYATIEDQWRVYNYEYLVIYPLNREAEVRDILGSALNDQQMKQDALVKAKADLQRLPNDAFAWFTLGTAQHELGNEIAAAADFDKARAIGLPVRMLWYQFGPFEAYLALGRYKDVIDITSNLVATTPMLEESHYYMGKALEALGRKDEARAQYQLAIKYNPHFSQAAQALKSLSSAAAAPASSSGG